MDESLSLRGFRRHALARNAVGHLQLKGDIGGHALALLVDTGAASTVVDLSWCRARSIPLVDTGRVGGGAGGVTLPIFALGPLPLTLDGESLRSDRIFALDLSHVNAGLKTKGAQPVDAVLGADVMAHHLAIIDYATLSLFLKH